MTGPAAKCLKMADRIDKSYFTELTGQNPTDICRQALCDYDSENKFYTVRLWTNEYRVDPVQYTIAGVSDNFTAPHEYFYLFIIYYLLKAKNICMAGEWISDKDITGGSTFFRGPHNIPTDLICNRFHNDIEAFKKRCTQLQGTASDMADASFTFKIAPRIPVTVLYWQGDEDFPPEAKLLYDGSITKHLSLDIIFAMAVEVCSRIGGKSYTQR